MASLSDLLQSLSVADSSSSDSSDEDSDSDDNGAGLLGLLAVAAAARAAGDTDDPVAKALAGLVVLKGLEDALSDSSSGSIRVGDLVRLDPDEAKVKRLQEGHGGWNPEMTQALGQVGSVVKMLIGSPVVHFGQKTWRLNTEACTKLTKSELKGLFSFGDRVYVEFGDNIAKEMQKAHGGWNSLMHDDLVKIGRVVGCDGDGDVAVQFWTRGWRVNSAACRIITTETGCDFKVGDRVFMDNDVDIGALKVMQGDHRAWSPAIVDMIGRIGEVVDIDKDGDLGIKIGKKKMYLTPNVCTKVTSVRSAGGDFYSIGDTVSLGLPADILKTMQEGHGNWAEDMAKDIGKKGKVIAILPNGDINIQFDKNKWRLNPAAVTKHATGKEVPFKVGMRVSIDMEPVEFLKLQIGHGGVNTAMLTDLGKVGKILEIYPDKDLMVEFAPNLWSLNPAICTKLSDKTKPKFTEGDRVFIALDIEIVKVLQEGHGGFVDTMYRLQGSLGKVCKVLASGDIVVRYGILPVVMNPAIATAFLPVGTGGSAATGNVNTSPFSPGDRVRIDMDVETVKKLQDGHGGWSSKMQGLMGHVGRVDKVDKDGDLHVVYSDGVVCLNPAVCTLIKAGDVVDNSNTSATPASDSTDSGDSDASMRCEVCKTRNISIVFGCGHGTCGTCSDKLKDCPSCQASITYRTNLFF